MLVLLVALVALSGYFAVSSNITLFLRSLGKSRELKPKVLTLKWPKSLPSTSRETTHKNTDHQQVIGSTDLVDTPMVERRVQPVKKRIVVAITGATGAILAIRLLEKLQKLNVETHLVISKWADATISYETDYKISQVRALATKSYSSRDVSASIASGSFKADGMIVVPCTMKTLSAIANGYADDLISRAADVMLKERRRLVVVARETPLSGIHLENMLKVTQHGAIIFPPVPAFYTRPSTIEDIVTQSVGRMLDMFDLDSADFERWGGIKN